jgi:hypothetical protein
MQSIITDASDDSDDSDDDNDDDDVDDDDIYIENSFLSYYQ